MIDVKKVNILIKEIQESALAVLDLRRSLDDAFDKETKAIKADSKKAIDAMKESLKKFKDGKFVSIVADMEEILTDGEQIRYERPTPQEIFEVKQLVESKLGKPVNGNILYHLDYLQLENYTDDEIAQILSF